MTVAAGFPVPPGPGLEAAAVAATLLVTAPGPGAPQTATEWGLLAVVAAYFGKLLYDLVMKLVATRPGAGESSPAKPPVHVATPHHTADDVMEALARVEAKVRDVRDRVHRLDDLHQVRAGTGEPVWYCAGRGMGGELRQMAQVQLELLNLVGRLLDQQRQGNGLVSKLARRLKAGGDGAGAGR